MPHRFDRPPDAPYPAAVPTPAIERIRHSDGYEAAVRWWLPPNRRGAVLYLHGIQSHGGWYEHGGTELAARGYAVLMPDRRGSGLNDVDRGHAESCDRLLADGRELIDALRARAGSRRVHLVGVSWGGKWSVALATTTPDAVASMTLVAPGLFPRLDLPLANKFRIAWSLIAEPTRPVAIPLNDPSMFTRNPARLAELQRDALRLFDVTAAFLLASRRMDRYVAQFARMHPAPPTQFLLAGRDVIIDNTRTQSYAAALRSPTRIIEFPDASHTLEFESDPAPFRRAIADWMDAHADAP
ncbi:MAG: lysophospholipase [Phycisphaerae bacterium]|nr:lysophospholipase [Phycisphaerae bacterium]